MPYLRLPRRSPIRAPQRVTGINWASPLAYGLRNYVTPLCPSHDLATGERLTIGGATPPIITDCAYGVSFYFVGASYITSPRSWNPTTTDQFSLATLFSPSDVGRDDLVSIGNNTLRKEQSAGKNSFFAHTTGGYSEAYNGESVTPGSQHHWIGTIDATTYPATNHHLYADDTASTSAASGSNNVASASGPLVLGSFVFLSTNFYVGHMLYGAAWDRALPEDEARAHLADPWDLLASTIRTYFIPAAAGGGATALDQATETGTANDITPVPGAVSVALDQATETGAAADLTATPGAAAVALEQAAEAGTPADVTPAAGATAVALDQATETGTAADLTPTGPGQTVLEQAAETGTANDITPVPGAVAITLDQATETGTAADVTPAPGAAVAALDQAAETGTPADLTPAPGVASVTLDQAAEAGTTSDITPVQAGAQVIVLDQATETGSARDIAVSTPSSLIPGGDEVMRRRGFSGQMYADEVYERLEAPRKPEEKPEPAAVPLAAVEPIEAPAVAAKPAPGRLADALAQPATVVVTEPVREEGLSADDALMLMLLAA